MKIKKIVEDTDSAGGRVFDCVFQFLIIFSLISFAVETLPDLGDDARSFFKVTELIIVILFTIEYALRLLVADKKLRFMFSFYGLIDLLAILPYYLASGLDLRSIRIFRLFRLVRSFKLLRYSRAVRRLRSAFLLIKDELILFLVATALLLFVGAVGIYYFENPAQPEQFKSVFHCLWWAVSTLTTVGYGDMCPITTGGRVFTFFILIIGLGIVAVPTGLIASALTKVI